jgi:hypothetical protein
MAPKRKSSATSSGVPPTIHEATISAGTGGTVAKGANISENQAVDRRRKLGLDIVVCGADDRANRDKAADIERAACGVGKYIRHGAHPSAGSNSLPHYQPKIRPRQANRFTRLRGKRPHDPMKYFTPELFVELNSDDDAAVDRAEGKWLEAIRKYRLHLKRIGGKLPLH